MTLDWLIVEDRLTTKWIAQGFPGRVLASAAEIRHSFEAACGTRKRLLWLAGEGSVFRTLADGRRLPCSNDQRLLLLGQVQGAERSFLHALFRFVVAEGDGTSLLPVSELREALAAGHRADLFIGGAAAHACEQLLLYRGDLEPVASPFLRFSRSGTAPQPNFKRLRVTDFGHTVRLGRYEASADVILYEHDAEYRRRAKARSLQHDSSLGGSVRRLRLLKGVRRDDFPGISAKQVARIERGEISKPHGSTMRALARRLGVDPSEIPSY